MAARINRDGRWDKHLEELRRKGYAYLLRQIEGHYHNTGGHLVDSVAVVIAIGRRALDTKRAA